MRPWLRWTAQITATLLLTWVIVRQLGVSLEDALALDRGVPAVHWGWLTASVLALFGCFVLAARIWGWMVRDLGGPDPGARASLRIVLTANLGRYIPGKVWQIAGLALLSRRAGVPAALGTGAGLLVQGFTLVAAGLWGVPAILDAMGPESGGATGTSWFESETTLVVTLALVALCLILAAVPRLPGLAFRFLFRLARRNPDEAPVPGPGFGPRWIAIHLILWGGYGLAFVLLLMGLGFRIPVLTGLSAFTAAYLMGYVVLFAPAGLGVREGVLIAFLQPHLGGAAVAVAVLARLWMTAVELVPAGVLAGWEVLRPAPALGQTPPSDSTRTSPPDRDSHTHHD